MEEKNLEIERKGKVEEEFVASLEDLSVEQLIIQSSRAFLTRSNFERLLKGCTNRAALMNLFEQAKYGIFSNEELRFIVSRYRTRESLNNIESVPRVSTSTQ